MIVSVCRLEEGGRSKCHKYWPEGDSLTDPKFKNLLRLDYKVKLVEEKAAGPTLVIREFEVSSDSDGGKAHKCT